MTLSSQMKDKGDRPPPVIITNEVQGHRHSRAPTGTRRREGKKIDNEAEAHRNKMSMRLIYGA